MAASTSSLTPSGLKRYRNWYQTYIATHGNPPPSNMMTSFMEGEIQAQMSKAESGRALDLEQQRVNISKKQYAQNYDLQREQLGQQAEAARMQGLMNLGVGAYLFKDQLISGAQYGMGAVKTGAQKLGLTSAPPSLSELKAFTSGAAGGVAATSTLPSFAKGAYTMGPDFGPVMGSMDASAGGMGAAGTAAGAAEGGMSVMGMAGAGAAIYGGVKLGQLAGQGLFGDKKSPIGGMAGGAAVGTMIFPGVGTIIGAGVGLISSVFGSWLCTEVDHIMKFDKDQHWALKKFRIYGRKNHPLAFHYYLKFGPELVKRIADVTGSESTSFYNDLNDTLVQPVIQLSIEGKFEDACLMYIAAIADLFDRYIPEFKQTTNIILRDREAK